MYIVILKSLFEYNLHINKIIIFSVRTVGNLKVKFVKKYLSKYYANAYLLVDSIPRSITRNEFH